MMTNIFADKSSFLPQYQFQITHSFIALPLCAFIGKLANQILTLLLILVKYVKKIILLTNLLHNLGIKN